MRTLRPLTPAELSDAEGHLLHPPPGSRSAAAKAHGTDLTLLIEQLRLTPAERAAKLERAATELAAVRGIASRHPRTLKNI